MNWCRDVEDKIGIMGFSPSQLHPSTSNPNSPYREKKKSEREEEHSHRQRRPRGGEETKEGEKGAYLFANAGSRTSPSPAVAHRHCHCQPCLRLSSFLFVEEYTAKGVFKTLFFFHLTHRLREPQVTQGQTIFWA
eukprot:TRINITY_DN14433_c2_g1_i2.p1 TRINITY_DN14433_c2_g1~~TRINITY_DN14433_c2_g1_i2.p1  ORF type:complete len:135 (+),score=20.41 TRINITY_DN14433_c2_g1_i2:156-560(+)